MDVFSSLFIQYILVCLCNNEFLTLCADSFCFLDCFLFLLLKGPNESLELRQREGRVAVEFGDNCKPPSSLQVTMRFGSRATRDPGGPGIIHPMPCTTCVLLTQWVPRR